MFWHKTLTFKPQNNYLTDKSEIWVLLLEMLRNWLLYGVKLYKPDTCLGWIAYMSLRQMENSIAKKHWLEI